MCHAWFWEPYYKQIKINLNLLPQQYICDPLQVSLSHLTSPWLRLCFPQNTNHSSWTICRVLLCALGSFFCFAAGFTGTTCLYKYVFSLRPYTYSLVLSDHFYLKMFQVVKCLLKNTGMGLDLALLGCGYFQPTLLKRSKVWNAKETDIWAFSPLEVLCKTQLSLDGFSDRWPSCFFAQCSRTAWAVWIFVHPFCLKGSEL